MSEFPLERWLEDQLWQDGCAALWPIVRAAASYHDALLDAEYSDERLSAWRQVQILDAGTCDILVAATSSTTGELRRSFIVELKRIADEGAVAQVLRYCGSLASVLDVPVVPIVVAFQVTKGAQYAASATHTLHIAEVSLSALRVPAAIGVGRPPDVLLPILEQTKACRAFDAAQITSSSPSLSDAGT